MFGQWQKAEGNPPSSSWLWSRHMGSVPVKLLDDDAEFIRLARNAFEVMMRRGWHSIGDPPKRGWNVRTACGLYVRGPDEMPLHLQWDSYFDYPDPFTALVEADKWYRENVEAAK